VSSRDLVALSASAVWLLLVLATAEVARRRGMARVDTRRIVHVAVASWVVPTFLLYEHWLWAAAPALLFVGVNALSLRLSLIASVEIDERSWGTVFFPLSVAVLTAWGWNEPWRAPAVAGVLVMGWGDAAASFVGRRWGRRFYHVKGHRRSVEGSMAMLGVGWLAVAAAFLLVGGGLDGGRAVAAIVVVAGATVLEGISLLGADNLLVPLATAGGLALLHGRVWS